MSLKLLVTAALAAVDVADDIIFDAEMKTTEALDKLRDLKTYLDAAPKTAVELVDGCLQYKCTMEYVNFGSPRYIFSRAQLEDFAQTAFAAGCAHGYAAVPAPMAYAIKDEPKHGYDIGVCEPVHDYNGAPSLYAAAAQAGGTQCAAQEATSPATPIRILKSSAVDLMFSDGTCVNVRVAGK